jgi:hypothetical protein
MLNIKEFPLRSEQQVIVDRFISACQGDDRIIAGFLGGSYARKAADPFSDLDLYLITTDEAYDDFHKNRYAWMLNLGKPVFLEDFGNPNLIHYIFDNWADGEIGIGSASRFQTIHAGPYEVLLDKRGILSGANFIGQSPDPNQQAERLRRLFFGFWHELDHFISAFGRGQLWWAQGQLEAMREMCISLARLRSDFFDIYAGEEPYFKFFNGDAVPVELFSSLKSTFGPLEKDHLYQASLTIVQVFHGLALPLSQVHGIPYPESLEHMMVERLKAFPQKRR